MRILVTEDEDLLAEAIATGLRRAGHAVDVALDGERALEALDINPYDVLVLDRDLPGIHGDEVCQVVVREAMPTRVLMVTASGDVDERVHGLHLGADDYLAKPFAFRELVARVEALGRRGPMVRTPVIECGDIRIDTATRQVTRAGRTVDLTPKEYGLLTELAAAPGVWRSAEYLLDKVWDENADPFTSTVRITMARLRRKLGSPDVIETQRGVGYRMAAP